MILLYLHIKSQIMNIVFGLGLPGGWEWIIIGLIVVIFFGANKIPEIFKGFGKGIREFKDASREIKKEIELSLIHI